HRHMRLVVAVLATADGNDAVVVGALARQDLLEQLLEFLLAPFPELGCQLLEGFDGAAARTDAFLVERQIDRHLGINATLALTHAPFSPHTVSKSGERKGSPRSCR